MVVINMGAKKEEKLNDYFGQNCGIYNYREQSFVLDKDVRYQVSSVMRKSAFYTPCKTEF